jgi:hypothetical protein
MMNKKTGIFAILLLAAGSAGADEGGSSVFKFNGFATLGVAHSSERQGDYAIDRTFPTGVGLSQNWGFDNDSRLGMQMLADLTPKVRAVLQVMSEYSTDGNYKPSIEWANLRYAFSPDFYVRVGRIALPTFLNSENRDVGYSLPWVRTPIEFYRQVVINSSDGVDVMARQNFGEATNIVKVAYGKNSEDFPDATETTRNLTGVFDTVEYGAVILHGSYLRRETSTFSQDTGVTGPWESSRELSLGASYDPGKWFASGEWWQRKSSSDRTAMYATAGYRIQKFTPFVTYSQDSPSTLESPAAQIGSADNAQSAVSVGSRWDFMRNADLKVQYDQIRLSKDSNGNLINVPAGVKLYGSQFHVFSLSADVVF